MLGLFFPYGEMAFLKSGNVLSPGGRLLCRLLRGPFVFNLGFIGLDYRTGGFKIHMGKCVFKKLEIVLSPGGRLLCRLLRGPFVFNFGFIGLDYRTRGLKIFSMGKCFFEKLNVSFINR